MQAKNASKILTALNIIDGDVVAVVGCSGKSSLIERLASSLEKSLITTTVHIYPPKKYDRVVLRGEDVLKGINLAYSHKEGEKLCGLDAGEIYKLCPMDGVTLIECDGSRGMPFKGYAEYEPVVPAYASKTVGVVGLRAVGEVFAPNINVHRPDLFAKQTGARAGERIGMNRLAKMICGENGMFKGAAGEKILLINTEGKDNYGELVELLPESFRARLSLILFSNKFEDDAAKEVIDQRLEVRG